MKHKAIYIFKMYVKNVFVPLKELPALSKNFLGSFNDRYTY